MTARRIDRRTGKLSTTDTKRPTAGIFLTGSEAEIRRVCALFREDYFPHQGLIDHLLHTAIIDRDGRLTTNPK